MKTTRELNKLTKNDLIDTIKLLQLTIYGHDCTVYDNKKKLEELQEKSSVMNDMECRIKVLEVQMRKYRDIYISELIHRINLETKIELEMPYMD